MIVLPARGSKARSEVDHADDPVLMCDDHVRCSRSEWNEDCELRLRQGLIGMRCGFGLDLPSVIAADFERVRESGLMDHLPCDVVESDPYHALTGGRSRRPSSPDGRCSTHLQLVGFRCQYYADVTCVVRVGRGASPGLRYLVGGDRVPHCGQRVVTIVQAAEGEKSAYRND